MAKPPAKFEPRHPREEKWKGIIDLLRELFQLSARGAPETEIKSQIGRLKTELERLEQFSD